jgi:hypothetical protein
MMSAQQGLYRVGNGPLQPASRLTFPQLPLARSGHAGATASNITASVHDFLARVSVLLQAKEPIFFMVPAMLGRM